MIGKQLDHFKRALRTGLCHFIPSGYLDLALIYEANPYENS